jgi:hypothetical protein
MSTAPALPIAVAVGDQCRKAINVAMMSSAPRITDRFGRKVIAVEWVTGLDSGTGRQPVSAAPERDTCPEYRESLQGCSSRRGLGLHMTRTFSPAIGIRELVGSSGGRVERAPSSLSIRRIRPDFAQLEFENDLQTATKGTRALACGYKLLINKDLFGGEGGIRPPSPFGLRRDLIVSATPSRRSARCVQARAKVDGGEGGIRTHVPFRTRRFRGAPVTTTSVPLRFLTLLGGAPLTFPTSLRARGAASRHFPPAPSLAA